MGVPGAKSYNLVTPGYGNLQGVVLGTANPYYARFASSPMATMLGDAAAQNPSFFTLWIGNNDVLGYATSGGFGVDQTGNIDFSTYGSNDISDPMAFAEVYDQILQRLTEEGAKGVVVNIPDVTTIPFFTTVPYNPVLLDAASAELANDAYITYNNGLSQAQELGLISTEELEKRTIVFNEGAGNPVVIFDEDLTNLSANNPDLISMRQTTADDLLVLTSQTILSTLVVGGDPTALNGVGIPLADNWVLTPEEQLSIQTAADQYNQTIEALATQYDLAFFDAKSYLEVIATQGVQLSDGSVVTSTYATGSGFSLDGVHPSPRGYALLANQLIEVIETKYGAKLPKVEPLDYTGLYLE